MRRTSLVGSIPAGVALFNGGLTMVEFKNSNLCREGGKSVVLVYVQYHWITNNNVIKYATRAGHVPLPPHALLPNCARI